MFKVVLMSRHAWREMQREKIPVEMVLQTYEDPDETRSSDHDELREIRTRWFDEEVIEVVHIDHDHFHMVGNVDLGDGG